MMHLLKLFKKKKSKAQQFIAEFEKTIDTHWDAPPLKLSDNAKWKEIEAFSTEERLEMGLYCLEKIVAEEDNSYQYLSFRKRVFKSEFVKKITNQHKDLFHEAFEHFKGFKRGYNIPTTDILQVFSMYYSLFEVGNEYMQARNAFVILHNNMHWPDLPYSRFVDKLIAIDNPPSANACFFDPNDVLGKKWASEMDAWDEATKDALQFCWAQTAKTNPTEKWLNEAKSRIAKSKKHQAQIEVLSAALQTLTETGKAFVRKANTATINDRDIVTEFVNKPHLFFLGDQNRIGMCYLVWYASLFNDAQLNADVANFASACFLKISGQGPLSLKNGNACLYAFTQMSKEFGILHLLNIRNKSNNKNISNMASKYLSQMAEQLGLTEDEMGEMVCPDFGIVDQSITVDFGNFEAQISTTDLQKLTTVWWNKKTSKSQKSTPKEVQENFATELKAFKNNLKEIGTTYKVNITRLESTFLANTIWDFAKWKKYYVTHPFLSQLSAQLIWYFDQKDCAIFHNGIWQNAEGKEVDISNVKTVQLWHPIYGSAIEIEAWRDWIFEKQVKQPFKQAYREIYLLTDAEVRTNVYSNRFAAHIIYQHQYSALCKNRNWEYSLQGNWDSHNVATKPLSPNHCYAEFWADPVEGHENEAGVFNYLATDQVRFYQNNEVLNMSAVPPMIFTEIMRDVDLFVGVCSIGNNPDWADGGPEAGYWQSYSFGDLSANALTRKNVLEKIVPKLKIAASCTFNDKFLVVKGKVRTYKIHLGSGNILMSPNDQYLCIVPDSKARSTQNKVFLPFEDDRTLSIILSKALLLANDSTITDTTILSQIHSK